MSRVIAAVDGSAAAATVVAEAAALGALLAARVEAVTVREPGAPAARLAGVDLRVLEGAVTSTVAAATAPDDVVALVVGAGMRRHATALGHQARRLITVVTRPVVVVAAEAEVRPIRRILVPLDGTPLTAAAMRRVADLLNHERAQVVAVHVHTPETVPMFSDQPHYEREAWGAEFLRRQWGATAIRHLSERLGDPAREVVAAAAEERADLVVLGWSRDLSRGRARVVKAALDVGRVPVLLVAVAGDPEVAAAARHPRARPLAVL